MSPEWADALPMLCAALVVSLVLGWAWSKDVEDARLTRARPLARTIRRVK